MSGECKDCSPIVQAERAAPDDMAASDGQHDTEHGQGHQDQHEHDTYHSARVPAEADQLSERGRSA
jgi:hypothetical protein